MQFTCYTRSQGNKAYLLNIESENIPVYCHMTSAGLGACGGGGWTLVMKIDGSKVLRDFHNYFVNGLSFTISLKLLFEGRCSLQSDISFYYHPEKLSLRLPTLDVQE